MIGTRSTEALVVRELRPEPLKIEEWQAVLDKKKLGPKFRWDAKAVENTVEALSQNDLETLAALLEKEEQITLSAAGLSGSRKSSWAKISLALGKMSGLSILGIIHQMLSNHYSRILYSLLEQIYWHRAEDVVHGVSLAKAI